MRCNGCGVFVYEAEEKVHTYYPGAKDDPEHYCSACWGKRQEGAQRIGITLTAVVILGGLTAASIMDLGRDTFLARAALMLLLGYFLSTVLHEIGHAAVARGLGLHVERVSFGSGRPLWTHRIAGIPVQICSYPVCGFVEHIRGTRQQGILVTLGGPLANVALLTVAWALGIGAQMPQAVPIEAFSPWHALVAVNVIILFTNLVPFEFPGEDGKRGVVNDGLSLLRQLRGVRD